MQSAYETFKKEIYGLREQQEQMDRECTPTGMRYLVPLAGRKIPILIYRKNVDSPVLFCCHGGGFAFGTYSLDDALWNLMNKELCVTVISIGYRKTPEYEFPKAQEDVYETISYVQEHAKEYGIESNDYSIYGNSAGANLATTVCMLDALRGNRLKLKRQILNYPYCDLATGPIEKGHPRQELFMYQMFVDYYCVGADAKNPLISPVYAKEENLREVPRAVIILAESDPLHAEGARYISKLRLAGISVELRVAAKMPHGYSETYFQGDNPYLTEEVRMLLLDGTMEREVMETIAFIKRNY